MDKNRIISARFLGFSKYLGIISAISFIVFLLSNAYNTGSDSLFLISYISLMISIVGALQAVCLFALGKYFATKTK